MRNVLGAHLLLLQLLTKHVTCNLMFVYGIWSAGYRAPLGIPYPNDENTRSKWPRGWNRPTEFGLNQMYEMGTWMRRRYVVQEKAISPVYDNGRVRIRSASRLFCITAAELVASGLFPEPGKLVDNKWSNGSLGNWHPTAIFVPKTHPDPLLLQHIYPCKRTRRMAKQEKKFFEDFDHKHRLLYKSFEKLLGIENFNYNLIPKLAEIQTEIVHGLPQPAWLNRTYEGGTLLDWIRNSYNTLTTHDYNTKLKTRLRVGVLVNDIVESLINRVYYGRQPSQALFNSVNGPTILGLKHALGIADGTVPEPGTLLLVEVHRTLFDEYIVQIYSRNTSGILISHRLPTCARNCLLDDFITILRPMRLKPEDLDVMCERTDEAFSRHANLFGIVLILPILLTLQ